MNPQIRSVRRNARSVLGARRGSQQGLVLVVAIVVVIAMALGAYTMLRSAGSSLSVAGNVSFKQTATSAADVATESARQWMLDQLVAAPGAGTAVNGNALIASSEDDGYFAEWDEAFDPFEHDWANDAVLVVDAGGDPLTVEGNQFRYVIHRMCRQAGTTTGAGQQCVIPEGTCVRDVGSTASSALNDCITQPFYRVTTQVTGPRNTVSFTQVLMFF